MEGKYLALIVGVGILALLLGWGLASSYPYMMGWPMMAPTWNMPMYGNGMMGYGHNGMMHSSGMGHGMMNGMMNHGMYGECPMHGEMRQEMYQHMMEMHHECMENSYNNSHNEDYH